jgi:hypothetical protein
VENIKFGNGNITNNLNSDDNMKGNIIASQNKSELVNNFNQKNEGAISSSSYIQNTLVNAKPSNTIVPILKQKSKFTKDESLSVEYDFSISESGSKSQSVFQHLKNTKESSIENSTQMQPSSSKKTYNQMMKDVDSLIKEKRVLFETENKEYQKKAITLIESYKNNSKN